MRITIYVDGVGVNPSDASVFDCTMSHDERACVLLKDQPLIIPRDRTLMLDVSKATGSRYSIWVRDGEIPLLVFTSVVDVFSNSRICLKDGVFLNIHLEEAGAGELSTEQRP